MIKRFCDKCGKPIEGFDFRKLSITDSGDNYIRVANDAVCATLPTIDLCKNCANEVISFIKNK